jgi:preprotein translocase subunit Sec63
MKPLLLAIGVPEHQLFIIPREYKTKTLAKSFDWLHEVYMSETYTKCLGIYKAVTPETWERYEILGIKGLTEQRLLLEYGKQVIKLWKDKRPRLFINRQRELCENCAEITVFNYSNSDECDYLKECTNCNEGYKVKL